MRNEMAETMRPKNQGPKTKDKYKQEESRCNELGRTGGRGSCLTTTNYYNGPKTGKQYNSGKMCQYYPNGECKLAPGGRLIIQKENN